jgi:hydrogenase-4 component F
VGKSLLFFTAGNIRENFGTLRMDRIGGLGRSSPRTALALVVGSVAILGLPPFGLFVSEFAILNEAFRQSRFVVAGVFLIMLSVVFGGMLWHVFGMLFREPKFTPGPMRMVLSESLPIAVAILCLLLFGLHVPESFSRLIHQAMAVL